MFDTTMACDDQHRRYFEQEIFGHEIMNVISCEGFERVQRPDTYKQWQIRRMRAGFRILPLKQELVKKLRGKVKAGTIRDMFRSVLKRMIEIKTEKLVRVCCWLVITDLVAEVLTEIEEDCYGMLNFQMSIKLVFFSISYGLGRIFEEEMSGWDDNSESLSLSTQNPDWNTNAPPGTLRPPDGRSKPSKKSRKKIEWACARINGIRGA
ncbi:hypothetical protein RHMOL_Rhmol13G0098200 [Rhododendron molle]|uniref:Uncharacterized protein n=1 Tax=Rhododendron molle TaxID=49168 RepID=A0ACC0L5I9_RHOML|nr:hypothetical protein RHMOL_Rhmol13G0098200 [Rhododendron molle]